MPTKIIAILAALLLVAACESKSDVATNPGGTGTGGGGGSVATPGSQADFTQNVGDHTFFEYDSFALTPQARTTLSKQGAWWKQYAQYRIVGEGHCDERGTREYNLALGARRANAVREYLTAHGVSAARIETISYGKEKPIVGGSDDGAWAKYRNAHTASTEGAKGQ